MNGSTEAPAVVVSTHVVRPDRVDPFTAWADRLDGAAARRSGFLHALRLTQSGGVWHLIHAFADEDARAAWQASPDYRTFVAEAEGLSVSTMQRTSGRLARLQLPGEAAVAKWKRFVMTWAAVFPTLLLLNGMVALFPNQPNQFVKLAITSPLLTAALTWLILPRVSRWLKPWMLDKGQGEARRD